MFVYDRTKTPVALVAGCHQFGRYTNAEFYFCLGICFYQPNPGGFRLLAGDGSILPNTDDILPVGVYYVVSPGGLPHFNCADC